MDRAAPQLTELVRLDTLQQVQENFAALGRMSVVIAATDGTLVTEPSWGSPYSKLIGTSPKGRTELVEGIRAGSKNPKSAKPVMCHEGMQLYTTPIVHDDCVLAILAVGTRKHQTPDDENLLRIAAAFELDVEEFRVTAAMLDPKRGGTREAIHRFADVLARMIATLFGQAERIGRQLADLRTVHEFSELLSGTKDLQQILNRTVHRVVEVMPVKACAIRLLDGDTGELVIKAVHNLSEEYLKKGPVLLRKSVIDSAAFAGESVYIEDSRTDPRIRYPENARREGIVSGLCVPASYRGQTIGVIRVYTGERYVFTETEEALVRSIGSQTAAAIIHSRLFAEQAETERIQRQVEAAGQIQRRMIPARPPAIRGLSIACVIDPTLAVGGDFYDFIELPDGKTGLCIADVAGKGMPAALLMASIRSALRAYAPQAPDPSSAVKLLNRHTYHDTPAGEFATLTYVILAPDGRSFHYSNAGHLPPILLRGEQFVELNAGGLAIGVLPDESYEEEVVALKPGDTLVMVTDGVTEAMSFHGDAFGKERLLSSLWKHRKLDASHLVSQILWDVRRFVGLAPQSDDITIVVLRVE